MPSVHDRFSLVSDFEVAGDQVRAVPELIEGLNRGDRYQVRRAVAIARHCSRRAAGSAAVSK